MNNLVDISVIIPVYNEEKTINPCIDTLFEQVFDGSFEVIVADGRPGASTLSCIRDGRVKKIACEKGRGTQMNQGAIRARGRILLFLHCDTRLPSGGLASVCQAMAAPGIKAGAFSLKIDAPGAGYRIVEAFTSLRSRVTRIPFGDQGIFILNSYFHKIGRYRSFPIMEDVELMERIRKNCGRIVILKSETRTSARRWKKEGIFRTTLRNWLLRAFYSAGMPPACLSRFYPDH